MYTRDKLHHPIKSLVPESGHQWINIIYLITWLHKYYRNPRTEFLSHVCSSGESHNDITGMPSHIGCNPSTHFWKQVQKIETCKHTRKGCTPYLQPWKPNAEKKMWMIHFHSVSLSFLTQEDKLFMGKTSYQTSETSNLPFFSATNSKEEIL